jgi:hypothetical protein
MDQALTKHNGVETIESTPSDVFSIQSFEHAQRVAKMLSTSELIPKEYQGKVQNVMIALEMATRIGASPLMVMQNLYIVHGKPSWSSSFIIAALNSCKRFSPLRFEIEGNGDEYGCKAWALGTKDNERLEGPKVTWAMVKAEGWLQKNGSKWKTMPDLMFRYRAAAFFGRLYAPDILMGMQTMEETIDVHPEVLSDEIQLEELTALFEEKRPLLSEAELSNAQRIIDNREVASYKKLLNELNKK